MLINGHQPWTDSDTTKLRELHAAGKSLNAIATEMGRAKATISKYAGQAGLTFDRTRTAKAAEAVHVDNKARRVSITARVYDEAEDVLGGVEKGRAGNGWQTILKGSFGVEEVRSLDFVPSRDRRDVSDTLSRLLGTATKLEAIDASGGVEKERSLLTQLGEALGVTGPEQ